MNYTKPSVIGIDKPLQQLQSYLYGQICKAWGVTDKTYNCFGRAYRNQSKSGYTPEVYNGGNEYTDSYFDDTLSCSSFFGVSEEIKVTQGSPLAPCYLIVMVDLSRIKPANNTRNDEEARVDIQRILSDYSIIVTGYVTGIEKTFKDFAITAIKFRDMHPLHCFRINFNLNYNINDC